MARAVLSMALGAAIALTGQAAVASTPQACIARRNINGFSAPDDRTVYIRAGVNQYFRLDLMNDCLNLSFRQSIGFDNRPNRNWICTPLEATIVYRGNGIRQRCPVKAMRKLTPDEVAAVPKRDLP